MSDDEGDFDTTIGYRPIAAARELEDELEGSLLISPRLALALALHQPADSYNT